MRASRSAAREKIKSVRTRAELDEVLEMLNLTDAERDIARMVYGKGYTLTQVSMQTGYSVRQVSRKLAKVQDRMA